MKKFLILVLTTLLTVAANAQIFTQKLIRDKFDDVVSGCEIKTLIEKNDTAIIIEEKGNGPVKYVIDGYSNKGSKDNIVQLVGNVYGYEEYWYVILEKDFKDYLLDKSALSNEEDDSKRNDLRSKLIEKYCNYITHRVVTDKYGFQFLSEHYCIFNENDKKTIYSIIY